MRLVMTESWAAMDVPVQYFQSVIAIELAVSGALLWQMRFFESNTARRKGDPLPDARLRVGLALVLGATVFGSLWAMADEGPKWAAVAVTIGLALSLVPILLRVLPPLAKDAATSERDPDSAVTVVGLLLYVAVVAGVGLGRPESPRETRRSHHGRRESAGRTSSGDGEGRNRTGDTTVFSRVLYQLSYLAPGRRQFSRELLAGS